MTVSATLLGVLLKGVAASRPAANAVAGGTIYSATDTGAISQSDGSSWATWATISSGLADPMTTRGDLIFRNASNATARLPIGSAGKVLSSDGTDVSWQTPAGTTFSGARVYRSTTQSITSGAERTVSFDSERFDTDSYHEGVTNPSRITFPATGKYLVGANIGYGAANSGAGSYLAIKLGGSIYAAVEGMDNRQYGSVVVLVDVSASDYAEVILSVGTSQTLAAGTSTAQHNADFWVKRES